MNPELDELRQEVEELKSVTVDTNRQVRKMRRSIWWGRLWTLAWWLIVFSVSGAAYYYYLQPIITRAEQYYAQFAAQNAQARTWEGQAQQFFSDLLNKPQQAPAVPSGQ